MLSNETGLQILKIVSSFEHRIPKGWSHWLKSISFKEEDELGAKDWIHVSKYIECWDTYSRQPEKLRR